MLTRRKDVMRNASSLRGGDLNFELISVKCLLEGPISDGSLENLML
jgi:hypothetical protein